MDEYKELQLQPFDPAKCVDYSKMRGIGLIFVPERYQQPGMPKVTLFNASDLSCNLYGNGVIQKVMNEESKLLTNESRDQSRSLDKVVNEPQTTFKATNESNMRSSNTASGYQSQDDSVAMRRSEMLQTVGGFSNPSISLSAESKPVQGFNFNSKPLFRSQVISGQSSHVGSSIDNNPLCGTQSQVPFMSSNFGNNLVPQPRSSFSDSNSMRRSEMLQTVEEFSNPSIRISAETNPVQGFNFISEPFSQSQVISGQSSHVGSSIDNNPLCGTQSQVPFMSSNFANNPRSQPPSSFTDSNHVSQEQCSFGDLKFYKKPGLLGPSPFCHSNFGSNPGPYFDLLNNPSLVEPGSFANINFSNNPVSQAQLPVTGANSIPLGKNSIWDSNFGNISLNNRQNYHNSNIGTNDSLIQPLNIGSNEQFQLSNFVENPNLFPQRPNIYLNSSNCTENSNHPFHGNHTLPHGSSIDNNSFSHPTNVQFNSNFSDNSNHSFIGNDVFNGSNIVNNSLPQCSNLQYPSYNFTNTNNSSDGSCNFENSKLATDEREILPTRSSNAPNNQITGPSRVNAANKNSDISFGFRGRKMRCQSPRRSRYGRRYGGRLKRNYPI